MNFVYDQNQVGKGEKFWIKNGKAVEQSGKNVFEEALASSFEVRGKNYLLDKVKVPSEDAAFQVTGFACILSDNKLQNVATRLKSLKRYLELEENKDHFFFIVVRVVPYKGRFLTAISIARQIEEGKSCQGLQEYLQGDDDYKNKRFKYIPRIDKASKFALFLLKLTGGIRPVILGKGYLEQEHFTGENYYEIDIDISSSKIAKRVAGIILANLAGIEISECFLVEAQLSKYLPERILFANTFKDLDFLNGCYELAEEDK